jgi:hypothetical protein
MSSFVATLLISKVDSLNFLLNLHVYLKQTLPHNNTFSFISKNIELESSELRIRIGLEYYHLLLSSIPYSDIGYYS